MGRSNFAREQNDDDTWSLWWRVDGDIGGMLGDGVDDPEPRAGDDAFEERHECWRASQAAKPFACGIDRRDKGFLFKDERVAKAAQQAADAAVRNAPIAAWEAMALASGWTPPKTWKKGGA